MSTFLETGSNSCVIVYINAYKELRTIQVQASTYIEAEEIAIARGIKPVGIVTLKKIIGDYEKWKVRRSKRRY